MTATNAVSGCTRAMLVNIIWCQAGQPTASTTAIESLLTRGIYWPASGAPGYWSGKCCRRGLEGKGVICCARGHGCQGVSQL